MLDNIRQNLSALDPEALRSSGMMTALSILANNRPRPLSQGPNTLGSALGQGGLMGMQAYQNLTAPPEMKHMRGPNGSIWEIGPDGNPKELVPGAAKPDKRTLKNIVDQNGNVVTQAFINSAGEMFDVRTLARFELPSGHRVADLGSGASANDTLERQMWVATYPDGSKRLLRQSKTGGWIDANSREPVTPPDGTTYEGADPISAFVADQQRARTALLEREEQKLAFDLDSKKNAAKVKRVNTFKTINQAIDSTQYALQPVNDLLNEYLPKLNYFERTGVRVFGEGIMGKVSQDVADATALLEGVRTGVITNTLKRMRDGSIDGSSGLGQITQRELELLEATFGGLNVGTNTLEDTLLTIRGSLNRLKFAQQLETISFFGSDQNDIHGSVTRIGSTNFDTLPDKADLERLVGHFNPEAMTKLQEYDQTLARGQRALAEGRAREAASEYTVYMNELMEATIGFTYFDPAKKATDFRDLAEQLKAIDTERQKANASYPRTRLTQDTLGL